MNRLTEALADVCRQQLLTEKWLIASSIRVGYQWLQVVSRSGQPAVNVRVRTPKGVALELAAPELARRGATLVSSRLAALIVDRIFRDLRPRLSYFSKIEPSLRIA